MFLITFYCVGLFCDIGVDLGWSANMRFSSEKSCKVYGEHILANAIPPIGMRVQYSCVSENKA